MKFQVREGFVIHDTRIVKVGDKPVEQTSSYYEGDTVDFDEATAQAHLHKLEPLDKAAEKFVTARHAPVSQPAVAGMDPAVLSQLIATAVAAALAGAQAPAQPAEAGGKAGS